MLRVGSREEVPDIACRSAVEGRGFDIGPSARHVGAYPNTGHGQICAEWDLFLRLLKAKMPGIIHFGKCSNFEHSLLKMVTGGERSATTAGSDYPQGNSLVVQVSGGALARISSAAPSNNDKSDVRGK